MSNDILTNCREVFVIEGHMCCSVSCFARPLYFILGTQYYSLDILVGPMIMLSPNRQNHELWPNGTMFLIVFMCKI